MMLIFTRYDLTSEFMMYAFSVVMLLISFFTKPSKKLTFKITQYGFIMSVVTITTHIHLLWITCSLATFSHAKFLIYYYIYAVSYIIMLNIIMVYIDFLSYEKRRHMGEIQIKIVLFTILYLSIVSYPVFTNKLYVISDGVVRLTAWQNVITVCGILDATACLISSIIHVRQVAKIVAIGTLTFIPAEIVALCLQFKFPTAYFTSFTYVMPFTIYYCLFHAIKYNDIVGCQSSEALPSMIDRGLKRRQDFMLVRVEFPQLKSREFADLTKVIEYVSSSVCRRIERLCRRSRIYMTSDYTFTMFAPIKNREYGEEIIGKIREILEAPTQMQGIDRRAIYKQIVIFRDDCLKDSNSYKQMLGFEKKRLKDDRSNECIIATEKDYQDFMSYYQAQKLVLDIKARENLSDDRVLCFIQPIYSLETGKFRSGEALMRMQDNGKMIFPDAFIPAAEENNCIHTLTLIMINRICRKIKELEDTGYDFDGITVNCSTSELADPDFYKEIEELVGRSRINPKHLRLEVTESTIALDANCVRTNMQNLVDYGISFYLDDYGTGYSNIERMASYPFKTIKFDKSILYSALKNPKTDELVRIQIDYFKRNGYSTVVEGVEDEKQLEYCRNIGFDMIQGYYFSKPQPAANITEYFTRG